MSDTPPVLNGRLKGLSGALAILLVLLSFFEGNRLTSYRDVVNVLSICQGITQGVYPGEVVTQTQCDQMDRPAAQKALAAVDQVIKPPQPDWRRAALASLAYNVGTTAFQRSSIPPLINAGDNARGCAAMLAFVCVRVAVGKGERTPGKSCFYKYVPAHASVKASGWDHVVSKGLVIRRTIESNICLTGIN